MRHVLNALLMVALVGCAASHDASSNGLPESGPQEELGHLKRIELRFRESSIPPQWHRSYTIDADARQARVTVDVYGDELVSDTHVTDEEVWTGLSAACPSLPANLRIPDDGSTGFSAHTLTITGDKAARTLQWSSTMSESLPGMAESVAFAERVNELVPNLQNLLDTEYVPE